MMAWDALQDPCLIFLCFAALVSFIVGIIFDEGMEWLEVRPSVSVLGLSANPLTFNVVCA